MSLPYAELIGDPVSHSLSPEIHNHWLSQLGIVGEYRSTRVSAGELASFLEARAGDPDWLGCNLTMPLKNRAFDLVVPGDETASRVGAFNTVFRRGGSLVGINTDCEAIEQALAAREVRPCRAAILGSGGAASAAIEAFRRLDVPHIVLIVRSSAAAAGLLDRFGLQGEIMAWGEMPATDLLINATPLGMIGNEPLDVDLDHLPSGATVFDMVYSPLETGLLASARRRGLATIDGLEMLILQAATAFSCFFAAEPDRNEFASLRDRLKERLAS
jgi:shikimate dehydrogenase